ncbi:hypothetical protein M409DRAFT_59226 [Zasmidium cellare ATCC 36951]|uniref:Uncharacterized protein n=1 Tax=Zasmidium cellare ATCC 36951 TaxID=1080233 RepID=A0A6A6C2F2_ZASCE|nr:uncharacterized protein M409DRAFT_59226 [Zasmidium cellare ATCC 36951]KAF2161221.1 hypothetical protein M409DRAFT_59226 [Zasmidium cellare ATCC 36951]
MAAPTCHCFWNGQITTQCGNVTPCGTGEPGYHNSTSGTQLCCVAGDTCGANSICRASSAQSSLYSGFYLGGCTDASFDDPLCRRDCNDRGTELLGADVVYEQATGVWSCCGRTSDGTAQVDCDMPVDRLSFEIGWTPDQFPGPVGKALTPGVTTTVGSATSAASSTATGVGVALGALALIGLIAAIVFWRKRKTKQDKSSRSGPVTETSQSPQGGYMHDSKPMLPPYDPRSASHPHEMNSPPTDQGYAARPYELNAAPTTHELDSRAFQGTS